MDSGAGHRVCGGHGGDGHGTALQSSTDMSSPSQAAQCLGQHKPRGRAGKRKITRVPQSSCLLARSALAFVTFCCFSPLPDLCHDRWLDTGGVVPERRGQDSDRLRVLCTHTVRPACARTHTFQSWKKYQNSTISLKALFTLFSFVK